MLVTSWRPNRVTITKMACRSRGGGRNEDDEDEEGHGWSSCVAGESGENRRQGSCCQKWCRVSYSCPRNLAPGGNRVEHEDTGREQAALGNNRRLLRKHYTLLLGVFFNEAPPFLRSVVATSFVSSSIHLQYSGSAVVYHDGGVIATLPQDLHRRYSLYGAGQLK